MKNLKSQKIQAVDLFSGAGGLSLAAKNVGIKVRAAIELDKDACVTYRKNLINANESHILYEEDITKLDPMIILKDIGMQPGELDLMMGGPPCQGYSRHRIKDQGVDDPRNMLLLRYFDYVSAIQPKVFLVENVPGLLWKRHEFYLKMFFSLAKKAGYKVFEPVKVNAKDYGVPQSRQRVFILGVRNDIAIDDIEWPPKPTHFATGKGKYPEWKTASTVFEPPDTINVDRIVQKIGKNSFDELSFSFDIPSVDKDSSALHMSHKPYMVDRFSKTEIHGSRYDFEVQLPCHSNGYQGHQDVYGRIFLDKPGPTMTTGCMNPSKGRFLHPWRNHGITIRHAARFQTFPLEIPSYFDH
jgi:DNA (cytosine-5)-methyltransferase 1